MNGLCIKIFLKFSSLQWSGRGMREIHTLEMLNFSNGKLAYSCLDEIIIFKWIFMERCMKSMPEL